MSHKIRTTRILILTFIFISLSTKASAQYQNGASSRNLIASALQDILSTSNTEGALQMLKMTAGPTRKSLVPETGMPGRIILPKAVENLPLQTYMTNEMPRPVLPKEIPIPYNIIANKDLRILRPDEIKMSRVAAKNEVMAFMDPNEIGMPRAMANKEILMGPGEPVMPRVMRKVMPDVYEKPIYGIPAMEQNRNFYENRLVNYLPMLGDEVLYPCSRPSLINPFLPMASPVSAFSPTTLNSLPPPTQGRSQYLRKIPIPPPTI